jgi:glycosyltransferase involved in cell wall biosynthesis
VRSRVPDYITARYDGMENLRIVEKIVPWEILEQEYRSADIYLHPTYNTSPATFLDAMSYELPVVTIDSWGNAEYVQNGKTGLVAPRSKSFPLYYAGGAQPTFFAPEFFRARRILDHDAAGELAKTVAVLIENREMRENMGRAARWEVENGMFSLTKINCELRRFFDAAVAHSN